jgi:hypothetical protein
MVPGAYQRGSLWGLHSNGRLLTLYTNIKIGWKWKEVTNTLDYQDTATITAVKFYSTGP